MKKMQQQLKVELTIKIPEDMVLISKVELEELQKLELTGGWWSMKDLEKRLNKSSEWIKEKILYQPRFKKLLDSDNGGFVYYPKSRGQTWSFQANKMAAFLDKYFSDIYKNNKK